MASSDGSSARWQAEPAAETVARWKGRLVGHAKAGGDAGFSSLRRRRTSTLRPLRRRRRPLAAGRRPRRWRQKDATARPAARTAPQPVGADAGADGGAGAGRGHRGGRRSSGQRRRRRGRGRRRRVARRRRGRRRRGSTSPGNEATGRWTKNEHETFLKALRKYGKEWKKVALMVKTRTVVDPHARAEVPKSSRR